MSSNHITRASFPFWTSKWYFMESHDVKAKKKKKTFRKHPVQSSPFHRRRNQDPERRVTHPRSHRDSEPLTFCQPVKTSRHAITYLVWLMFNIRARSWTWRVFSLGTGNISPSVARTLHSNRCPGLREALFTAKPFHWASFSALKAPSELIHFISAKAPGETDEMLELKGNL